MWFRVDNRLIHGQVIEGWLPYTGASHLIVVNDKLAHDSMRQQIMMLAVSRHIDVSFVTVTELPGALGKAGEDSFVLFENCRDAEEAAGQGVSIPVLNIGNIHYSEGCHQIYPHVALSDDDIERLRHMHKTQQTELDFRAVPSEAVSAPDVYLF